MNRSMEFHGKSRQVPGNVPKKVVLGLEDCHRYKQDEKVFTQHPRRALAKNQIKFLRMKKLPSGVLARFTKDLLMWRILNNFLWLFISDKILSRVAVSYIWLTVSYECENFNPTVCIHFRREAFSNPQIIKVEVFLFLSISTRKNSIFSASGGF